MSTHIVPVRTYLTVCGTLMALTALTVGVAFIDLGAMNTFVAVTIAVTKALIVILWFMHVKYSDKLIRVYVAAGFVWLAILVTFTLSDVLTRGWVGPTGGGWQ